MSFYESIFYAEHPIHPQQMVLHDKAVVVCRVPLISINKDDIKLFPPWLLTPGIKNIKITSKETSQPRVIWPRGQNNSGALALKQAHFWLACFSKNPSWLIVLIRTKGMSWQLTNLMDQSVLNQHFVTCDAWASSG